MDQFTKIGKVPGEEGTKKKKNLGLFFKENIFYEKKLNKRVPVKEAAFYFGK